MALVHECGPSRSLCNQDSRRYSHPPKMKQAVYKLICSVEGVEELDDMTCICHACYKQVDRNISNENFQPRWKDRSSSKGSCVIDGCSKGAYRRTQIASPVAIGTILGKRVATSDTYTPLCKHHYTHVQNTLRAPQPCSSCNTKPKWGAEQHTRHCPEPDLINSYLTNVCSETSALTASSTICIHCYRHFTGVVSQLRKSEVVLKDVKSKSCESIDMDGVLARLTAIVDSILDKYGGNEVIGEDLLDLSFCKYAKTIAAALSRHEAMLLPVVYRQFTGVAQSAGVHKDNIPTKKWLVSRIYHYFDDSVVFQCKHRHFGTMLYHKDCDLLKALSFALGQQMQEESIDSNNNDKFV